MVTFNHISPQDAFSAIQSGTAVLIDIREPDERARCFVEGSISLPLSTLERANFTVEPGKNAIFHCKSGMRTESNCAKLGQFVEGDVTVLQGGIDAWQAAGLPVSENASAPLEIQRQVQITAGLLILAGLGLGFALSPKFFALSAFVGAGLTFAGATGWCGMAHLLRVMPWNRRAA